MTELFPEKEKDFSLFRKYLSHIPEIHYATLYPEIAFVSDFPEEINRNPEKRLHADGKAAMQYRDTYGVYCLNGIVVPQKLIETPAKELKAKEWLKESNVDIRREAFRKIGIEKVVTDLGGKTIDKFKSKVGGEYELILCDIGLDSPRPFLKMMNQSIGEYHIEGIPVGTKTVEQALAWRNGFDKYIEPKILT